MLKKIACMVLVAVLVAPLLALAYEDTVMLTAKKYVSKPENGDIDIFWDKSEIKKKHEDICYFEVNGTGLVEALRNANKMANKNGADAILILQKSYAGSGGSGILFGKMIKYQ